MNVYIWDIDRSRPDHYESFRDLAVAVAENEDEALALLQKKYPGATLLKSSLAAPSIVLDANAPSCIYESDFFWYAE